MKIPFDSAEFGAPGAPPGTPISLGTTELGLTQIVAVVKYDVGTAVLAGLDPAAFSICPDGCSIVSELLDTDGCTLRVICAR